ncbi:hypothetical protein JCGZ_03144 [Jatropha curcas]|uniref:Uncharacterized protein n=1 Tax=Jatropha curcas TaxID=180498 RepID=A0A067JDM4_JATCU|nr:hypothetical protein JCGZ_03144 [Jatropha curcas]
MTIGSEQGSQQQIEKLVGSNLIAPRRLAPRLRTVQCPYPAVKDDRPPSKRKPNDSSKIDYHDRHLIERKKQGKVPKYLDCAPAKAVGQIIPQADRSPCVQNKFSKFHSLANRSSHGIDYRITGKPVHNIFSIHKLMGLWAPLKAFGPNLAHKTISRDQLLYLCSNLSTACRLSRGNTLLVTGTSPNEAFQNQAVPCGVPEAILSGAPKWSTQLVLSAFYQSRRLAHNILSKTSFSIAAKVVNNHHDAIHPPNNRQLVIHINEVTKMEQFIHPSYSKNADQEEPCATMWGTCRFLVVHATSPYGTRPFISEVQAMK